MADDSLSPNPRIVGMSVNGPPPLGRIDFRLEEGLHVLYGLNGAGKSAFLDALKSAFTGIATEPHVAVHLQVDSDTPEVTGDWDMSFEAISGAVSSYYREYYSYRDERDESDPRLPPPSELGTPHVKRAVLGVLLLLKEGVPHDSAWDPLYKEIAEQGHVSLIPCGLQRPRWAIWISARLDETAPTLRRAWNAAFEGRQRDEYDPMQGGSAPYPRWLPVKGQLVVTADAAPWVPVPLAASGVSTSSRLLPALVAEEPGAATLRTEEFIRFRRNPDRSFDPYSWDTDTEGHWRWHEYFEKPEPIHVPRQVVEVREDSTVGPTPEVRSILETLSRDSSRRLAAFLLEAPELRCVIKDPNEWLHGPPLEWQALDRPSREWVSLDRLSQAEQRWAEFAILMAVEEADPDSAPGVTIVDEPEAALHVLAQRHLLRGLKDSADTLPIIVASHSPEFMSEIGVRLHHVSRDARGVTQVHSMDPQLLEQLRTGSLGAPVATVLQLCRLVLIVEGTHDEILVAGLLGDQLDELRALVIPMRGARRLAAVLDSELLFRFMEASVIIVLDGLDGRRVSRAWEEAVSLKREGKSKEADASLRQIGKTGRGQEPKLLQTFCANALSEAPERVAVFGFRKRDIIEYLNVDDVVPGAKSWHALFQEWRRAREEVGWRGYKKWLRESKEASLNATGLRDAVSKMDHVPDEFTELLSLCRRMATGTHEDRGHAGGRLIE